MTREEAITILKHNVSACLHGTEWGEALDMAIKALEKEPCEDAISRKAAIRWVKTECNPYGKPTLDFESGKKVIEHLKQMPSVTPKLKTWEWIPVSERLPDQGQEVICQCRANMIKALKLDADFDWYQDADHCYMHGFVIAWMPLPEPYKAESENEA
jgi:hypothetical protein